MAPGTPGSVASEPSPFAVLRGDYRAAAWVLLLALAGVTVAAWSFTLWMGGGMSSAMLVMMLSSGGWWGVGLFLLVWAAMMVAMMFPSAAPMAQEFVHLTKEREARHPWWTTRSLVFLGSYVLVWTAVGLAAAAIYLGLLPLVPSLSVSGTLGPALAGAVLLAAGVYQATPLKDVCAHGCRTPFSFLSAHWRSGNSGALRLGVRHAAYCVGCCWMLFAVLFAVGIMAVGWMALISLLIFVEKLIAGGWARGVSLAIGGSVASLGGAILLVPAFATWALGLG
ncbi:MAG TPA: DUF2182 domain-containing protein [Thermoplasmata archaeon]|nr:DUF2182 domain-containing protein [Thermoplasmata archaeon]